MVGSEAWRQVDWAPEYEVSNLGRVRRGDRLLKPVRRAGRYPSVNLRGRQVYIHRLVMAAFGPPPPAPDAVIRHLDDDGTNNMVTNLAWGTRGDNAHDARRNGRMPLGDARPNAKLGYELVTAMRKEIAAGASYCALARRHGVHWSTVRNAVLGVTYRLENARMENAENAS